MWQTPVTDRTQDDVDYAREHRNEQSVLIGAQNYTDWNRLTRNMAYIANALNDYGYGINITCRCTWYPGDIPRVHEIEAVRDNLNTLRHALYGFYGKTWAEWMEPGYTWAELDAQGKTAIDYFSTRSMPDLPYTQYLKINNLEEWTRDLNNLIGEINGRFRVSGTFASGQLSYLPRFIQPHNCDMIWAEWDSYDRTWAQIDAEGRAANVYFNKCFEPEIYMDWQYWDDLDRTWAQIDAEGRTAQDYFRKDI